MTDFDQLLQGCKVMPVLVIDNADDALPLAEVLCDAGLNVLEVTMRTPAALDAVKAIADNMPKAIIGVGTVLEAQHFKASQEAGSQFYISPGHTASLIDYAKKNDLAFIPASQTISEMMHLREQGFLLQKFFPAELNGGIKVLKAAASVLSDVKFCPTGGVNPENAPDYLAQDNISCVGGSWIAPRDLINAKDWDEISKRAKLAAAL